MMQNGISDLAASPETTVLDAKRPRCAALFAVGRGGNPLRHLPLLESLADQGCTIIAPHFAMLPSIVPTKAELDIRIARLEAAADSYALAGLPLLGIGHSIGAAMLLAVAGGEGETRDGQRLALGSKWQLERLALLAPAVDFFRRPGALRNVRVPIRIWAGAKDAITPPDQALFLQQVLAAQCPIDIEVVENAGHFTFMHQPPPQSSESHPDRSAFLAALTDEIVRYLLPSAF